VKRIILVFLIVTSAFSVSAAHAYLTIGRVWTSTANPKNPVAYSGNIPSSYLSKINSSLADWDMLPGSSLNTGTVTYTSSVSTYDNAAFQITRQDVRPITGSDDPAVTITGPGANIATVFISSRWTWSNSFDRPNNVGHLRTVVTHEFGHAWGINHPDADNGSMTAVERNSVMNSNFTVKYVPNSDDIAAMASMY
jgi:hypothetical protein